MIPILLVLFLSALLYVPFIQNFAVRKATSHASEALGMKVNIDQIRLYFPLNFSAKNIEVITAEADTLVALRKASVDIMLLPLFNKEVTVKEISIEGGRINTGDFVDGMTLQGTIGELSANADKIDLVNEVATLNTIRLRNSNLSLLLKDSTTAKEPDSTSLSWKIFIEKVSINELGFDFRMESDSMQVHSFIDRADLAHGFADLGISRYEVGELLIDGANAEYDANRNKPAIGLDGEHLALYNMCFHFDSIVSHGMDFNVVIRDFFAQERSGLNISSLTGRIQMDSTHISIPTLSLMTPYSDADLQASIPWEAIKEQGAAGRLSTVFSANLGKRDVLYIMGNNAKKFEEEYPNKDITIAADIEGNLSNLKIGEMKAELLGTFCFNMIGEVKSAMDNVNRSADIAFLAETGDTDFLLSLLPPKMHEMYNLPSVMRLEGTAKLKNQEYNANVLFTENSGKVSLEASYNARNNRYSAVLDIDSLEPVHFMPNDSLMWLTASVKAEGQGTDIFSDKTWATVKGRFSDIRYGGTSVSDISINGSLKQHQFDTELISDYPLARMSLSLLGSIEKDKLSGMLIADVDTIDLQGFHLSKEPLAMSFQVFSEFSSDFKKNHNLDITLGNWDMVTTRRRSRSRPKTLTLLLRSNPDTSTVSLNTGDLNMVLSGSSDLITIQDKLLKTQANLLAQIEKDSTIDVNILRQEMPEMHFSMRANRDNPIYNILQNYNMFFSGMEMEANLSPIDGFKMEAGVHMFIRDSLLLDTVRVGITQDSLGFLYNADIIKKRYMQQEAFSTGLKGLIRKDFANAELSYTNQAGEKGLELGIKVEKLDEGINIQVYPEQVTLAFHKFNINNENHILIRDWDNISANIRLLGQENRSLWIHSIAGEEKMDELHIELSHFNLKTITSGFDFTPNLQGILNVDLQYAPMDSSYILVADMNVDNLLYEGSRVGEMALNAVYLPLDATTSQIDVHLFRDRNQIGSLTTLYQGGAEDYLDGSIDINDLPLEMFTAFIPDNMASLNGALQANLSISGNTKSAELNGFMKIDTGSVYLGAAASRYRFDSKPITIQNSLLSFDKYRIYAYGDNPLVIDGVIDMNDFANMTADMSINANNMELLNAPRTRNSLVYGRTFINLNSTLRGPLSALNMRGNLQLLGNTNMTYVMTESQLTVQDRLSGLVTFISFGDTLFNQSRRRPPLRIGGMNSLLTMKIDPAVQLKVDLTQDQSSRIELRGGGDLTLQYSEIGDMLLNGRYTLSGGSVQYKMPIVSNKNFSIQNGSYVEWSGNVMNPRLNITATERMRVSAAPEGATARMVNFDVGIKVQETLENMSLDFTLDAPEDMAIKSDLIRIGEEEQRKQAVALLVSGVYLGSGGRGNFNMGNALNNFLSNEINNIAGNAFRNVDLSFGMESYDETGLGTNRTDYTFSFSKRFYNDRIRVVLGARLSSGEVDQGQDDNFIDNVSVEYLLDASGNRFVKLFHDKNYESILEGEVTETGAGIVLKRKMRSWHELFNFRKTRVKPVPQEEEEKPNTEE